MAKNKSDSKNLLRIFSRSHSSSLFDGLQHKCHHSKSAVSGPKLQAITNNLLYFKKKKVFAQSEVHQPKKTRTTALSVMSTIWHNFITITVIAYSTSGSSSLQYL